MEKAAEKQWRLLYPAGDPTADGIVSELSNALNMTKTTAKLLYLRGYRTVETARRFFRLEEAEPHDPFLMRDMRAAADRVHAALERHERIAVYGDYDVDGVTSVSLLYLYLSDLGADVGYYIPSRSKEGYGLSKGAIDQLREKGVSLMVTVDTGITAVEEIAYAKTRGIETVVTDHHECCAQLPDACAAVNPHRPDDAYPFPDLAGVGVAFKLVCALEADRAERAGTPVYEAIRDLCDRYADLVALGTVADVMPMTDENRLFVAKGISVMENRCRYGLQALIDAGNAGKSRARKITSSYIGFTLAPRMNAAGRVAEASLAVELLLADRREQADALAERLCELNAERQAEENRIAEEAYRQIGAMPPEERSRVLVIDSENWHPGIIGIVASRVTERYGLPSILITYEGSEEGVGKGSGRSVKGLDLVEALGACSDLLVRYGGHELAAGLSVRRKDVPALRRRLNEFALSHLTADALTVQIDADCELSPRDLTVRLAEEIDLLEPFGTGNNAPLFLLRDATARQIKAIGSGKHTRFCAEKDGVSTVAVWFGKPVAELPFEENDPVDLLFQLQINEFNGVYSLQMLVREARVANSERERLEAEKARYREIENGAAFGPEENVLPDRGDVAVVYQALRRETALGHTSFPIRRLLGLAEKSGKPFTYAKMRIVLRVLAELQLCGVNEVAEDHFLLDFRLQPPKTDLERSSVLREFRARQTTAG